MFDNIVNWTPLNEVSPLIFQLAYFYCHLRKYKSVAKFLMLSPPNCREQTSSKIDRKLVSIGRRIKDERPWERGWAHGTQIAIYYAITFYREAHV